MDFETIRREAPVQAYVGTVVEMLQTTDEAIVRLSGGTSMRCKVAMEATANLSFGSGVMVVRFPESAMPVVISTMNRPGVAPLGSSDAATNDSIIYKPDNFAVTSAPWFLLAHWDVPYPYKNYAFLVEQADDDGAGNPDEPTATQMLVTKGSYYVYYGVPGTTKHIRVKSIKAASGSLNQSAWTDWVIGTILEPITVQAPETELGLSVSGGELTFDPQDPHTVLSGPCAGVTKELPSFRLFDFTELDDTPDTYAGSGHLFVRVKNTEDGLEFASVPSGGSSGDSENTVLMRFHADGPLASGLSEVDGIWRCCVPFVISSVMLYVQTKGTASSVVVDIDKSSDNGNTWASIFPAASKPELIWNAADHVSSAMPDERSVSAGDLLRMNIDQVASGSRSISVLICGDASGSGLRHMLPLIGVAHRI